MIQGRILVTSVSFLLAVMSVSSLFGAMPKSANVRVGLPGRLSSNWPLYVAAERGFFAQEGLNVELIAMRNATIQVQALIAGDLQVNHNSVDSTARAFTGGAPLKFIGSAQQKPSFRLLAGKDINDWKSLRGKFLAAGAPGGLTHALLVAMLDAHGLKKGDYDVLSMGLDNDRGAALRAGRVEATLLIQPTDFLLLEEGFKSMGFVGDFLKDCEYNGYVVNGRWAKDNGPTVVAFMRSVLRALVWLHNPANKDEAIKIHAKYIPFKPEWLEKIYDMLIREKMLSSDGKPNMRGIENLLQISVKYGAGMSTVPPLDRWVDLSYLDKAAASLK
jgi:ABC-type nitrate/sulfonate/bicarbonate transport system substrate-binding protein